MKKNHPPTPLKRQPVPRKWQAYIDKHTQFVRFSARVAREAWAAGATYIFENPVDRGMKQSPHFCWRFRDHVPIWLMPDKRELVEVGNVEWVSLPQCAFGGRYQKWTRLLCEGPLAGRLRALRGLSCEHVVHEEITRRGRKG